MGTVLNHWASCRAPRLSLHVLRCSLLLSASLVLTAQAAEDLTLSIAPGDTLIGISQRFLQDPQRWPELKRYNRINQDRRLQPGSSLRIPLKWLRWSELTAEVVFVQGTVLVAGKPVVAGAQLKAGDSFDTGASGSLTLRVADGAMVVFPPNTQASLGVLREVDGTAVRATTIELQKGSADTTVVPLKDPASSFEIRTPRVVTAVRGTRFRVAAEGEASRHEVLTGAVAVGEVLPAAGAPGKATLNEAQGLRAEAGRLGAVVSLLPAANVSALPQRVERTAQSLTVPPLAGALAWRWQVATDTAFTRLLQDERTTTPTWLLTSLPDGDYHVRVRAADAQGLEGREAQVPLAIRARPEPPLLLSPSPGASVAGSGELAWTELTGAPLYQVQVARDVRFADLVLDRAGVKGNRLPMDAAWVPGTYYWRVATMRPEGVKAPFAEDPRGPFADGASFTLLPPSAMVPPEVGEGGLKLAWSGPAGFSHRVQVSTDVNFATTEFDQVVAGSRLELPTPKSGTYFVRTQVVLPDGRPGTWSSSQRFEVPYKHPWGLLLLMVLLPLL
jgi:hypothetical protein